MAAAASTETGRELLDDDRVVDATWPATLLHVGVFIPFGTVVLEEVAFRGVLPGLLDPRARSVTASVVVPALAFGAWHVVSAGDFVAAHEEGDRATGSVRGIVAATTAAGLVLGAARRAGGHLAAPAMMHLTANALATVLGRHVGRRRRH
nr:CPBP family intramembrane glutamic endopeptidase [Ornithinimicrobium sp. F0845]